MSIEPSPPEVERYFYRFDDDFNMITEPPQPRPAFKKRWKEWDRAAWRLVVTADGQVTIGHTYYGYLRLPKEMVENLGLCIDLAKEGYAD